MWIGIPIYQHHRQSKRSVKKQNKIKKPISRCLCKFLPQNCHKLYHNHVRFNYFPFDSIRCTRLVLCTLFLPCIFILHFSRSNSKMSAKNAHSEKQNIKKVQHIMVLLSMCMCELVEHCWWWCLCTAFTPWTHLIARDIFAMNQIGWMFDMRVR